MSAATQQAPTPRRRSIIPRTRKGRAGALAGLLALAAGTAYALYVIFLSLSGSVSGTTIQLAWDDATPGVTNDGSINCSAVFTPTNGTITATNAYPGDSCTIATNARIATPSAPEPVRVIGVGTSEAYPAGWSVDLAADVCGDVLPQNGDFAPVGLLVSLDAGESSPGTGPLPSDLRVEFVPDSQYTPALCTP